MNRYFSNQLPLAWLLFVSFVSLNGSASGEQPKLQLKPGDHICYIGNTMADRMQHAAWLETYLHALHPVHDLTFRNLGFPGDELTTRPRSKSFGSTDEWLEKCQADVVVCFFGYNEALKGDSGLAKFQSDLAKTIDQMRGQQYNGKSAPRLVFVSPIAHENLYSPHLPDGSENNDKLRKYAAAMREVCDQKNVTFVDVFQPTYRLYSSTDKPLTMNGIHLLDDGNRKVAREIIGQLFPGESVDSLANIEKLREAVLEKNYYWFSRYRVVDGYNVYGGRSTLAWHGQSNADVMKREMEIFDVMTENRDKRVWAVARGERLGSRKTTTCLKSWTVVKTNKPWPEPRWWEVGLTKAASKAIEQDDDCKRDGSQSVCIRREVS